MPSYLHDAELSDQTIGKALSSPLFTQEGEEPVGRRQAYHSFEESLLPSQSLSACHVSTVRHVHELSSLSSCSRDKQSRKIEDMQKSHVFKSHGTFRKKIDWRLPRSNFILPRLECQNNLQPWWQRRKTQMLRLTTCTPGMCWLHHCTFRSEKQVRAYCKLITRRRESMFQGAKPILTSTGRPVTLHPLSKGHGAIACFAEPSSFTENWVSKVQIWTRVRQLSDQGHCWKVEEKFARSTKIRVPEKWKEEILPKIIRVEETKWFSCSRNWACSDENKLYFTKNWQIENGHFVWRVLKVFKSWKNWREQEFRLEELSIRTLVEIHFEYVESGRSGHLFTLEFNQLNFSWTRRIAKPRLKFAARVVYLETFVHIQKRLLRQLSNECSIPWADFSITGKVRCKQAWRDPWLKKVIETPTNLEPND